MKNLYLITLLFTSFSFGQNIIFQETFDDLESFGSKNSFSVSQHCNDGNYDYFTVTDGSDINSEANYKNPQGSFYFAAMDTDDSPCGSATPTLEYNGIDISGRTDLTLRILLAEDTASDLLEDWDYNSKFYIEVNVDGGGYFKILQIAASADNSNTVDRAPRLDIDFDGEGDGRELSERFQEFIAPIPTTGSSIDLRITFKNLTQGNEDIAIDNVRITDSSRDMSISSPLSNESVSFGWKKGYLPELDIEGFEFPQRNENGYIDYSGDGYLRYSIDGGPFTYRFSPEAINFVGLTKGSHELVVELVDHERNSFSPPLSDTVIFNKYNEMHNFPFYEGFDYTVDTPISESAPQNLVWTTVSNSANQNLLTGSGSLSHPNLPPSSGNSLILNGSGDDATFNFIPVNSGNLYTSFILKVTDLSAVTKEGYFLMLSNSKSTYARVWIQPIDATNFKVGLSGSSILVKSSDENFEIGEEILVVLGQDMDRDIASLWLNPISSISKLAANIVEPTKSISYLNQIYIRQHKDAETPQMIIDEIRVSNKWEDIININLPSITIDSPLENETIANSFGGYKADIDITNFMLSGETANGDSDGSGDGFITYSFNEGNRIDKFDTILVSLHELSSVKNSLVVELVDNNGNSLVTPIRDTVYFQRKNSIQELPFYEPFDYTPSESIILNSPQEEIWTAANINPLQDILVEQGNLNYTDFPHSTGNSISIGSGGDDITVDFNNEDNQQVFVSFLLKVSDVSTVFSANGKGYFMVLTDSKETYYGRLWINPVSATTFKVGLSEAGSLINDTNSIYNINQELLVVLSQDTSNGTIDAWVNPNAGSSEPAADLSLTGLTGLSTVNQLLIRQKNVSQTPEMQIDELRITNSWGSAVPKHELKITSPTIDDILSFGFNGNEATFETRGFILSNDAGNGISDDSGDGYIKYTLDDNPSDVKFNSGPISLNGLSGGSHSLNIELVDNDGNSFNPSVSDLVIFARQNDIQSLPFLESFDYEVGESLLSQGKQNYLWSPRNINPQFDLTINEGSLLQTTGANASGNSLSIGNGVDDATIDFECASTGAVYSSFLLKVIDLNAVASGPEKKGYFLALTNAMDKYHGKIWIQAIDSNTYKIGISNLGSLTDTTTETFNVGEELFVVFKQNLDTGTLKAWVNPTISTSEPAEDISDSGASIPFISQLLIRQDSGSETPKMILDELKIGNSWVAVTSPPTLELISPVNDQNITYSFGGQEATFLVKGFTISNEIGSGMSDNSGDGYLRYKLNGGALTKKFDVNPINLDGLTKRKHALYIELVDNQGNPLSPAVNETILFTRRNTIEKLPFYDGFDYEVGKTLFQSKPQNIKWTHANSGLPTNDMTISDINIQNDSLPVSMGKSLFLGGGGDDVTVDFEGVTAGSLFASFILNIDKVDLVHSGVQKKGYFAIFTNPEDTYHARLWIEAVSENTYKIGVSDSGSVSEFSNEIFEVGKDNFIVFNQDFSGSVNLWVNPIMGTSIPPSDATDSAAAPSILNQFFLRQDSNSETPDLYLDELRITTTWEEAVSRPKIEIISPVENENLTYGWKGQFANINVTGFKVSGDRGDSRTDNQGDGYITYTVDNGPSIDKFDLEPISLNFLSAGSHSLEVQLVDNKGNILFISDTVTFNRYNIVQSFPFYESFDYNTAESLVGVSPRDLIWTGPSSDPALDLQISSGSLSYSNLKNSIGNSLSFGQSGDNATVEFDTITTGSVYASFVFKITDGNTVASGQVKEGYFAIFTNTVDTYYAKIWVTMVDATHFKIGLSNNNVLAQQGNNIFEVGEEIFLVFSQDLDTNSVSAWINPTLGGSEPFPTLLESSVIQRPDYINQFFIRQSTSLTTPSIQIDELRISDSWSDVTPISSVALTAKIFDEELLEEIDDYRIFPNPITNGEFFVSGGDNSTLTIEIYDLQARLLLTREVKPLEKINNINLTSGLYIVNIVDKGKRYSRKLIIR